MDMKRHSGSPREAAATNRREAGSYLKLLREASGLTQLELSKALGIEYYTLISQVESGKVRLPPERMHLWAKALGVKDTRAFARRLLHSYEPAMWDMIFGPKPSSGDAKST